MTEFRRWRPTFPRFALLHGPSPLQPMPRLSAALGGAAQVWIKREDLLPLAFGGNKLRNLEFLVGDALAQGADTLVTSGRRWSNHCRLTAAAGARAGLDVHVVLTGPPIDPPGPNQQLMEAFGARVHVTATDDRADREATVTRVMDELVKAGQRPYVIGVGGSGIPGCVGQVLAGIEVAEQSRPNVIVLPSATGGTQAGLLVGLEIAGVDARVLGAAVAHPADELRRTVAGLVGELATLTGCHVAEERIELDDSVRGPGYGIRTAEADEAAALIARTEGILVDPIYTAKALALLVRRVRDGSIRDQVVFWHAGGTPALFEDLPR